MNDHNVRGEVDKWPEYISYRGTAAAAPILNKIENYKAMRRSFNNTFPAMTKSEHTNLSFRLICQIRWFLKCCRMVQSLSDVILYKRMIRHYPQKRTSNGFRDTEKKHPIIRIPIITSHYLVSISQKCCHFQVILWQNMKVSRIHSTSFLKRHSPFCRALFIS